MSALADPMTGAGVFAADERRRLGRPSEGWLPLVLVAMLAFVLGSAMDEPAWVNGHGGLTDSLVWCAAAGAFVGFIGPKLGWGRWTTHLIGATFAGLALPLIAGWTIQPGVSAGEAFRVSAVGSLEAYYDLAWRGRQFTTQEVHYILVLGGICWGTLQFGAYAIFGHRRPLSAVLVVGLVLMANMGLTRRDQLGWIVLYTGASLLLLVQMHAFDERGAWARRRIGDPSSMTSMYLRGGAVFIALAMGGALLLMSRGVSAPLARMWSGLDTQLVQLGESLGRFLPVGGDVIGGGGVAFGASARITSQWFGDPGVAFRATVPADAPAFRWRAATYDTFALGGWEQSDVTRVGVGAGDALVAGTGEAPPETGPFITYHVTIAPDTFHDSKLLAPGVPLAVNRDATVLLSGVGAWLAGVDLQDSSQYDVTASSPVLEGPGAITRNELRAAATTYPADIASRYTAVPAGAMGPDASELLAKILASTTSRKPYDLADAIQTTLRGPGFTYNTDVRGVPCDSSSAVECFAHTRQGYCLHYASTMAILLRAAIPGHPIATRLVQGFLPGTRVSSTSVVVANRDAHAWVEVYFPGYGWIPFDPTGNGVGRPPVLTEGPVITPAPSGASPGAAGTSGPRPSRADRPDPSDPAGTSGPYLPPARPGDPGMLALFAVLLGLLMLAAVFVAWWRGPRGEISADRAWSSLSGAGARFGVRQRPTQTIYEYASALGDLVPVARTDLRTVADATVEATYGGTELAPGRLEAVRRAMRRLRLSMFRLVVRRIRPRGIRPRLPLVRVRRKRR
jgi:transglutaminase-like putative cysteine protease